MPQLSEIKKKRASKPFKKKEYRVWKLDGENAQPPDSEEKKESREGEVKKADTSQIPVRYQADTSRESIENQSGTSQEPIRNQTDISQEPVRNQTGINLDTGLKAIGHSVDALISSIRNLSGLQEKLFFYVLEMCNLKNELTTGEVKTYSLAKILGCNYNTAKTAIFRLVKKQLIIRIPGKSSQVGFVRFGLTIEQKQAGVRIANEKVLNPEYNAYISSIRNQSDTNLDINQTPNSSSNNYNITTTINKKILPTAWLDIDFEPIQHIGFSSTQIHQLYEKELNVPQTIQESINHFAFGLENNEKFKKYTDPLNVLMGVLRKGGAWTEKGYESPKDRALRELSERQKKQDAERKKYMTEIREAEFRKWIESMTNEELSAIAPTAVKEGRDRLSGMSLGALYPAFDEAIWSEKRKEIAVLLED